jgi:MFS family permease
MRIAIVYAFFVSAIGLALIAPLPNFGLVLVGIFLRGLGSGLIWVFSTQILLQILPSNVRGRVFSTEFAIQTLLGALSAYIVGWGLDNPEVGISAMMWIMCIFTAIFGIVWLCWLLIRRRIAV